MSSLYFENVISELVELEGKGSVLDTKRCLANSTMLSSDVNAAFDPTYASCFEKKNAAFMGGGMGGGRPGEHP